MFNIYVHNYMNKLGHWFI